MADIFISYSRADRPKVEQLAEALGSKGHSVWWDRHIAGGADFSEVIEKELTAAKVVIVAWSATSVQSRWVKDEAHFAEEHDKLVPIQLDNKRAPLGFRQFQTIPFDGWAGDQGARSFVDLHAAVEALLVGAKPAPLPEAISPPYAPKSYPMSDIPWILVAPIKARLGDPDLEAMAEELAEDIASGLSRFTHLKVASHSEVNPDDFDGAAYLLEGSLRRSGSRLRLAAQLIETANSNQLWGEKFDRTIEDDDLLDVQDDLTDHVVAAVGDPFGALMRHLVAPVTSKSPEEMSPYEAVLRFYIFIQRLGPADHLILREALLRATEIAPDHADVWACLAFAIHHEHMSGFNPLPDSPERALKAARQAVGLDPNNAMAHRALATIQFYARDLGAFRHAAKRAIELNPCDSEAIGHMGVHFAYAGDWEYARELMDRAIRLNPNYPGWYLFTAFFDEYHQQNYDEALRLAERINMPEYYADPWARAMTHAQLGHHEEAAEAVAELRRVMPLDMAVFKAKMIDVPFHPQPDLIAHFLDGMRKAGLEI